MNYIDGLPANTRTQEAVASDHELAEALLESRGGELPEGSKHPALRDWDQTASLLATVIEELRAVKAVLIMVNQKEGSPAPKVEPVLRPLSAVAAAVEKARMEQRVRKHDDLVRRLLGDRAKN